MLIGWYVDNLYEMSSIILLDTRQFTWTVRSYFLDKMLDISREIARYAERVIWNVKPFFPDKRK